MIPAPINSVAAVAVSRLYSVFHAFFSSSVLAVSSRISTAIDGSSFASFIAAIRCSSVILRSSFRHCIIVCPDTFSASAMAASLFLEHDSFALSSNLFSVLISPAC